MEITLKSLIERCTLKSMDDVTRWETLRKKAFEVADLVFQDRAESYNIDHVAIAEMKFGPLSIAGELYKRAVRMCGILTPLRTGPMRERDLNRLLDLSIDMMNIASWQYALLKPAVGGNGSVPSDDAPDYKKLGEDSSTKPDHEQCLGGSTAKQRSATSRPVLPGRPDDPEREACPGQGR
jgi:hypothetical protein